MDWSSFIIGLFVGGLVDYVGSHVFASRRRGKCDE